MPRYRALAIKLVLTAAIFGLVLTRVDLSRIPGALRQIAPIVIIWVVVLALIQTAVLAFRWRVISNFFGVPISLPHATRGTLVSLFFSQGLPASVGGDVFRIWWLNREGSATIGQSSHVVLLDRIVGFLSLLLLAGMSLVLLSRAVGGGGLGAVEAITGGSILCALALFLPVPAFVRPPWRRLVEASPERLRKFLLWLGEFKSQITQLGLNGRLFAGIIAIGVLIHLQTILMTYLLFHGFGHELTFEQCLAVIPPAMLLAYLPISIAGWGTREATLMFGFGLYGVPASDSFVVSVVLGLAILAVSVLGGALWLGTDVRGTFRDWQAETAKQ